MHVGGSLGVRALTIGLDSRSKLFPLGILLLAMLDGARRHRCCPTAVVAIGAIGAWLLCGPSLAVRARLGGQRRSATLARIELDRLRALGAALDGKCWVALLATRCVHKGTELGERAGSLAVGRALGTCTARARVGTILVRLTKPLGTLLMEAPKL